MAKKQSLLSELMAAMRLPGAPQLIVTREWAWLWLTKLGFPKHGGYNSADYMVFGRDVATSRRLEQLELTDLSEPWAVALIARMEADCAA